MPEMSLIGRRLCVELLFVLVSYFLGYKGFNLLDNKRRLAGVSLITVAALMAAVGLGLWWATGFRGTWGWPI